MDHPCVAPNTQVVPNGDRRAVERYSTHVAREVRIVGAENAREADGPVARRFEVDVRANRLALDNSRRRKEVRVDGAARVGVDARRRDLCKKDLAHRRACLHQIALDVVAVQGRQGRAELELHVRRADDNRARVSLKVKQRRRVTGRVKGAERLVEVACTYRTVVASTTPCVAPEQCAAHAPVKLTKASVVRTVYAAIVFGA